MSLNDHASYVIFVGLVAEQGNQTMDTIILQTYRPAIVASNIMTVFPLVRELECVGALSNKNLKHT